MAHSNRAITAMARFGFLAMVLLSTVEAKVTTPRFKWGQTKEHVFLSVIVRDPDTSSIKISLASQSDLHFECKTLKGEGVALDLVLAEDVVEADLKWEVTPRPDKFGTATLITLSKVHQHRWNTLVVEPKLYKGLMDKDWSREDQTLEPEEEVPYMEDHPALVEVTDKNFEKLVQKHTFLSVNVRMPWCPHCKSQDEAFGKAAALAKKRGKSDKKYDWTNARLGVIDGRKQKKLGRRFNANCTYTCQYLIFTGSADEAPGIIKPSFDERDLLLWMRPYLSPVVHELSKEDELNALKAENTTVVAYFDSKENPQYKIYHTVAQRLRGEMVFTAIFGKLKDIDMFPFGSSAVYQYDMMDLQGNGTDLETWLRPRNLQLVQQYDWGLRETYENLGIHMGKVWLDDQKPNKAAEKATKAAVLRLAQKYVGRITFVYMMKSKFSYELRDYALNLPELFPSFGIASNNSYQAKKYGMAMEESEHEGFWKDEEKVFKKLDQFCEVVLTGQVIESHESAAAHTNWTQGTVKRFAWRTYSELANSEQLVFLSLFSKYRKDNAARQKEMDTLAEVLAPLSDKLTVGTYDTSENWFPPELSTRQRFEDFTEFFLVREGRFKRFENPQKDAPIASVVEWLATEAPYLQLDTNELLEKLKGSAETTTPAPSTEASTPSGKADEL